MVGTGNNHGWMLFANKQFTGGEGQFRAVSSIVRQEIDFFVLNDWISIGVG